MINIISINNTGFINLIVIFNILPLLILMANNIFFTVIIKEDLFHFCG